MPATQRIDSPKLRGAGGAWNRRTMALLGVLFAAASACAPARGTGIYVLTGEDGSISLSNTQVDRRYTILLGETEASAPAALAGQARRNVRELAAKARFDQVVEQTARTYGLESALLHAVISVESGYNPRAVSRKGASGLMQLMPKTALRYGVADRLDPAQSIEGGAHYLHDLSKQFNSNMSLVLAAYNAGENAVTRYGNQIPPYPETMAYVPRVLGYYEHYQNGSKPGGN